MSRKDRQLKLRSTSLTDDDILRCFENWEEWLSRRQIGERVFRAVTPSFCGRLERMVGEGKLARGVEPLPNGQKMFWYRLEKIK